MPAVECFYSGAKSSRSVGRRVFLSYSPGPLVDKGEEREVDERVRALEKVGKRESGVYVLVPATESGDNGSSRMPPSGPTADVRERYQKSLIAIPSRFPLSCAQGTRNFIVSSLIRGRARHSGLRCAA